MKGQNLEGAMTKVGLITPLVICGMPPPAKAAEEASFQVEQK